MSSSEKEATERPLEMEIDVLIPHEDANFYVALPNNPLEWAKCLKGDAEDGGYVRLKVDNMPTGCGGVGISLGPEDAGQERNLLQMVVTKETLAKLIHALQLAHDHYIP